MHAHDRTYLASLGFNDPDKKNPEHDRICRYIATPEVLVKIGKSLVSSLDPLPAPGTIVKMREEKWLSNDRTGWRYGGPVLDTPSIVCEPSAEYHLTKGVGQYQTTIGFLDLHLLYRYQHKIKATHSRELGWVGGNRADVADWVEINDGHIETNCTCEWNMFVEVKAGAVDFTDILRQLQLYKTYFPRTRLWLAETFPIGILVAPWDIRQEEGEQLRKHGFAFLKLGDHYRRWAEADTNVPATSDFTL